jgi:O-antigen/teichoic acid export membrane protein
MDLKSRLLRNKELVSGAFSSFIFRILGLFAGYLFIVLAVKNLGVGSYGIFSLSLAFLQITAMIGRLGVEFSIVKHVAQFTSEDYDYGLIKEVYLKGLKLMLIAGSVLTLFVFFSADLFAEYVFEMDGLSGSLRIISLGIIPSIIYFYNGNALRGLKKPGLYSMVINFLVFFFSGIFLWANPFPEIPNLLSMIYTGATVLAAIISTIAWLRFSRMLSVSMTQVLSTREIISTSIPMLLSGAFIIFNGWIDTLILGILSNEQEVGVFHVLLKLAAVANIFVFAVNSIATPRYAQLGSPEKRDQLQQQVMRSNKLIAMLNIPVILGLLLLYQPILNFLGSDFPPEKYGLALLLLCIGRFVNSFCGSGGQLLNMTGYERVNQNITIIVFLINIGLNVILISQFGLFGAAFANMTSNILRNIGYVVFIKLKLNIIAIYNPLVDIRFALNSRR